MKKELIELQRGCKATCVVILDKYYRNLGPTIFMEASMSDANLFVCKTGNPIFKEKLENIASMENLVYFVVRNIDSLDVEQQNRYVGLVKDREFCGYYLPENVILVFTVKDEMSLKNISQDLYHFCVVAL